MMQADRPLIAVDVSKGKSHVQGFLSFGKPIGRPFVARHDKEGMAKIAALADRLLRESGTKPAVAFESTGAYSGPIRRAASEAGLAAYEVSPLESAKVRKSKVRPTKTDNLDCSTIAEVAYTRDVREPAAWAEQRRRLASLSRLRDEAMAEAVAKKNRYLARLEFVWPGFADAVDPFSPCALAAVGLLGHPDAALAMGARKLEARLRKAMRGKGPARFAPSAEEIVSYAEGAYSSVEVGAPEADALAIAAKSMSAALDRVSELDGMMAEASDGSTDVELLKTIDGVGGKLAASISAEIGDASRFANARKAVAFAGLDPAVMQSGKNDGLHLSITRKGNSRLRRSLYLAVTSMIRQRSQNRITAFVGRLKKGGLCHKAAVTAGARKLLLVIRSMLLNGAAFER